ncbi:MAG: Ig-like domain-containing protein [Phycisphaerae bacterium]|nr:Ig-like domain-containing protein [Gemmatimonadaceae bacterium]
MAKPTHRARARFRAFASRVLWAAISAGALVTVSSCGGGDDSPTNPVVTITRIDVTAPTATLSPAQTTQLTATARTSTGSVATTSITWSTSASSVASVNQNGVVTGVAAGVATITASGGGVSGSTTLTVVAAGGVVTSVNVTLSDASLIIGNIGQATVSARDASNAVIALGTRAITWSSTNPGVATVSAAGIVSAVGIGSSQIRASVQEGAGTIVGNATFTVVPDPEARQTVDVSMPGLTFSPADVVVKVNGTVRFIFPSLAHNVIWMPRIAGSPTDIGILDNQTVTRTFPTVGVFPYVCTLHNGMVGTVVVSP